MTSTPHSISGARAVSGGFTLVEILVTLTICSFITIVAMGSLRAVSHTAERIQTQTDLAGELRFAATRLRRDLGNVYRDREAGRQKFVATTEPANGEDRLFLTCYILSRTKARPAQPEGDVCEVEYFLQQTDERSALMRRQWPNPQREGEAGGVLSVIAEGINLFKARFHDGQAWRDQWAEDADGLPDLVEVTLGIALDAQTPPVLETILVSLTRSEAGGDVEIDGAGDLAGPGGSPGTTAAGPGR